MRREVALGVADFDALTTSAANGFGDDGEAEIVLREETFDVRGIGRDAGFRHCEGSLTAEESVHEVLVVVGFDKARWLANDPCS